MNKLLLLFSLSTSLTVAFFSCKKDTGHFAPYDDMNVNFDITSVPYEKLSEYNFFVGAMNKQVPSKGVIEYKPASTLFTDYALKKRFIWMPQGVKGKYVSDDEILDLPVGAVLIKNFYYDNVQPSGDTRIIETRLMIRKNTGWIFAEYVWNDEQTDAHLSMNGSYTDIQWYQGAELKSVNYRIPSETECFICHKQDNKAIPIGIKPQNLNVDFNYLGSYQNQLQKLITKGYLEDNLPGSINTTVDYSDASKPLDLRVRSYFDMNCAHCHRENSHCDYRPLRLAFSETDENVNMGLCVEPEEFINSTLSFIVTPSNIERSMLHYRLMSTLENERMPLIGRTLVHEEGLQLVEDWINSIETCD